MSSRPDFLQTLFVTLSNLVLIRTVSVISSPSPASALNGGGGDEGEGPGVMIAIPRTTAGRILMSSFWLFSVAMVACYTANMAAILTAVEIKSGKISFEAQDRRLGSTLRYGTVKGSDIESFFSSSVIFSRVGETMKSPRGNEADTIYTPIQTLTSDMVNECGEGIARVRSGESLNYVFLWHSPGIRYMLQNDCELNVADSEENYISYAIALPQADSTSSTPKSRRRKEKHSGSVAALKAGDAVDVRTQPSKDMLNTAIMNLGEKDVLRKLEKKWWGVEGCSQDGATSADADRPPSLTIRDLAGLFSILAAAILLSAFVGMIEYNVSRQRVENKRNRRPPDKNSAVVAMSDGGVTTPNIRQQMEEPFLPGDGADGFTEESFLHRGASDRHSEEPFLSQSDQNTDETFLPPTDSRLMEDRYISRRGSDRLIEEPPSSVYLGRSRRTDQSRRLSQGLRGELGSDSRSSDPFHLLSNSDNEYSDMVGSGSGISVSRQTQIF